MAGGRDCLCGRGSLKMTFRRHNRFITVQHWVGSFPMSRVVLAALCGSGLLVIPGAASAGLVDVGAAGLAPETPMVPIGAVPQGAYGAVPFTISSGPAAGSEIVFGSYFQGQT